MAMIHKWAGLALILAALVFSACSPQGASLPGNSPGQPTTISTPEATREDPGAAAPATPAPGSLINTRWVLISYGKPGSETTVQAGSTLTLEFGEAGQIGGSGGCNTYGSTYAIKGSAIKFGPVNATQKACADNNLMLQEQQYFQALTQAATFNVTGDRMLIFYNNSQGVLNFVQSKTQTLVLPAVGS
jgi:heat shock protein HslJ